VADVNNPKVVDDIIIGDSNTQSEALHNHKQCFYEKSREILTIQISANIKILDISTSSKMFAPEYNRWSGF